MKYLILPVVALAIYTVVGCKRSDDTPNPVDAIPLNTLVDRHGNSFRIDSSGWSTFWSESNGRALLDIAAKPTSSNNMTIRVTFPSRPGTSMEYQVGHAPTITPSDNLATVFVTDSSAIWYSLGTDSSSLKVSVLPGGKLNLYTKRIRFRKGGTSTDADTTHFAFNVNEP